MATYNGHNEDSSGNILLSIGNGMTATVETGSTASQAYTKGSYLFFNNRLCKATSAIASGATLAVGTNLSQTSIGQELTSHLRSSDGKEFYFDVKDGTYGYYPSASKTASEFVPFGGTVQGVTESLATAGTVTTTLGFRPTKLWAYMTYYNGSNYGSLIISYDSTSDAPNVWSVSFQTYPGSQGNAGMAPIGSWINSYYVGGRHMKLDITATGFSISDQQNVNAMNYFAWK